MFTLHKNSDAQNDSDRQRLDVVGQFHLGEFINRFRHGSKYLHKVFSFHLGSLVPKVADNEALNLPTVLFGTVSGLVGVIASLPKDNYDFFLKVEQRLASVLGGVGGIKHSQYVTILDILMLKDGDRFVMSERWKTPWVLLMAI